MEMLVGLRREAWILAVYSAVSAVASVLIARPHSVGDAFALAVGAVIGMRLIRAHPAPDTDRDALRSDLLESAPHAALRLAVLAAPMGVVAVLVSVVAPFAGLLMAGVLAGVAVRYALTIRAAKIIQARTGAVLARRAPRQFSPVRDRDPQFVRVKP